MRRGPRRRLAGGGEGWEDRRMGEAAALGGFEGLARKWAGKLFGAQRKSAREAALRASRLDGQRLERREAELCAKRAEESSRFVGELWTSIWRGSVRQMKEALAMGANPASCDSGGETAMLKAAKAGFAEGVELLLPLSDPAKKDCIMRTALMLCLAEGRANREVAKLLAPAQGRIACLRGHTPLMEAAGQGDAEMVGILLPWSDPLAVDADGRDALMAAAAAGRLEAVRLLLPVSDLGRSRPRGASSSGGRSGSAEELAEGFPEVAAFIRQWRAAAREREEIGGQVQEGAEQARPARRI